MKQKKKLRSRIILAARQRIMSVVFPIAPGATSEEWHTFFTQANLQIEHQEIFRRTHNYDDWTTRSQMPEVEKIRLETYILQSAPHIQDYFAVETHENGHIKNFSTDFIILKGRKSTVQSK